MVLQSLLSDRGALCVYKHERSLQRDWNARWRIFRERGEDCSILSADELASLAPGLDQGMRHGIHVPSIRFWRDPRALLRGLHSELRQEAHHRKSMQNGLMTWLPLLVTSSSPSACSTPC